GSQRHCSLWTLLVSPQRLLKQAKGAVMSKNEAIDALSREFRCERRSVDALKPNPHNPRVHPKQQIRELAKNILVLGFTCPILVDEDGVVLAGHARLEAAKLAGLDLVPVIVIAGLSSAQKRALLLADNRIAQKAKWNQQLLSVELKDLQQILAAEGLDI